MLGLGISILKGGKKQSIIQKFLKAVAKDGGEALLDKTELKALLPSNHKEYLLLGIPSARGKVFTEVLTNTEMTSSSGWSSINAGVTYNSSLQRFDIDYNGVNYGICVRQNVALPSRLYKVQVTFENITSGSVRVSVGGVQSYVITTSGSYEYFITTSSSEVIALNPDLNFAGSVSRFSAQLYSSGKLYNIIGTPYLDINRLSQSIETNKLSELEVIPELVPAIDFDSGQLLGLRNQSESTNVCLYSEDFLNAAYDNISNVAITTSPSIEFIAPNGELTAHLVESPGVAWSLRQNISGTNIGTWTISVYVKAATEGVANSFRLTVGGNNTSSVLYAETYWKRFSFTFTDGGGTACGFLRNSNDLNFKCYVWGMQVENKAYATSYNKTENVISVRNADQIFKLGINDNIGQTEGTIHLKVYLRVLSVSRILKRISIDSDNYFEIVTTTANEIRARVVLNSVTTNILTSDPFTEELYDIKFAYKDADYALSVNGELYTSTLADLFPVGTFSNVYLGSNSVGSLNVEDNISLYGLIPRRLTNLELES